MSKVKTESGTANLAKVTLELTPEEAVYLAAVMGGVTNEPAKTYFANGQPIAIYWDLITGLKIGDHRESGDGYDTYGLSDAYTDLVAIYRAYRASGREAANTVARRLRAVRVEKNLSAPSAPTMVFKYHGVERTIINPEVKGTLLGGVEIKRGRVVHTEPQYKNYHLDEVNR